MAQSATKHRSNLERDFHRRFTSLPYEANRLTYTVEHSYCPDFTLGPNLFVETKGLFTSADRSKHLHVKKQHPQVKVLFIFQNPRLRLAKGSKTTYADWCEKHGFKYLHINDIAGHTVESLLNILEQK